jgi:subtilisin
MKLGVRLSLLIILALALGYVLPASSTQAAPPTGSYIVVFKDTVDVRAAVPDVAQAHGLQVGFVYEHALKGMSAVVPAGRLVGLQHDPRVAYVVEDMERSISAQTVPTGIQRIFADGNAEHRYRRQRRLPRGRGRSRHRHRHRLPAP